MSRERVRNSMKHITILPLVLFVTAGGCKTTTEDDDTSNTFVRVLEMGASSSDFEGVGETVTDLLSDVCFADEDHPPCTVFNDNGVVTMSAQPKNLQSPSGLMNDVIFERYRVTYVRADGRNVPGVDVPFPFDGAANFRVPADGTTVERPFLVVRHTAKLETPLRELTGAGTLLHVLAQVDFFGRDVAGREVLVTGFLNITFGDFANE